MSGLWDIFKSIYRLRARARGNYTVEFTKPDGSKVTYGPFDAIGLENTACFEYVVDAVGTWKLQLKSPEQLKEGYYLPFGQVVPE